MGEYVIPGPFGAGLLGPTGTLAPAATPPSCTHESNVWPRWSSVTKRSPSPKKCSSSGSWKAIDTRLRPVGASSPAALGALGPVTVASIRSSAPVMEMFMWARFIPVASDRSSDADEPVEASSTTLVMFCAGASVGTW